MTASNSAFAQQLVDRLVRAEAMIEQLERRINNLMREAVVEDVDPEKGLVKVKSNDLESAWEPWMEIAGGIKSWDPPTKGQRVLQFSPSGEPGQGFVVPGGFSDANEQPSTSGEESVKTIGNSKVTMRGDAVVIESPLIQLKAGAVQVIKA